MYNYLNKYNTFNFKIFIGINLKQGIYHACLNTNKQIPFTD